MKLIIASDIHGAARACERLMQVVAAEKPDHLVLLGDLLYHGPRNDLPADYAPKEVIAQLNAYADRIIAVRGNCEAEVDQMVLNFDCMADSATIVDEATGLTLFCSHGHVWGPGLHNSVDRWPDLPVPAAFLYGHTHKKVNEELPEHPGIRVFNPGSVGIPKDGSASFGKYENGVFSHIVCA